MIYVAISLMLIFILTGLRGYSDTYTRESSIAIMNTLTWGHISMVKVAAYIAKIRVRAIFFLRQLWFGRYFSQLLSRAQGYIKVTAHSHSQNSCPDFYTGNFGLDYALHNFRQWPQDCATILILGHVSKVKVTVLTKANFASKQWHSTGNLSNTSQGAPWPWLKAVPPRSTAQIGVQKKLLVTWIWMIPHTTVIYGQSMSRSWP